MTKINSVLENVVNELKKNENTEGIILYGSQSTGNIHKFSDIDLLIIDNVKKRTIHNYIVEYTKVQEDYMKLELFTNIYTNEKDRVDDISNFKVLYDKNGSVTKTLDSIKSNLPLQAQKLSDLMRKRALLITSLESNVPLGLVEKGNLVGAVLVLHRDLIFLTNILCSFYGWWMVDEKNIIEKMYKNDESLAKKIEDIILEADIKQKSKKYIEFCKEIEQLFGGYTSDITFEFDF